MIFKKIQFNLVKNIDEANHIWNLLTPRLTIYDEWEFRYCFYKYFNYPLHFYVGYVKEEPIGLLPLQYNEKENYLEFFGGSVMNDNRVLIKPGYEKYIKKFYNQINQKAKLEYIDGTDTFTKSLPIISYQYTLPLENLKNSDDYIENYYQGETRKKFIKRIKETQKIPHKILINQFEDIELIFELNINKFKEESSFLKPHRQEIYRDLLRTPFKPVLLTYVFNEKKQGASFALIYKDRFVSFNSGINSEEIKNIDSFARLERIDYAIKAGLKFFDALSGNCGWKENWHFYKIPQYKFEKN